MQVVQRTFSGEADLRAMAALVHDDPTGNLHVVDLPYRLSSWALDDPENVGLWVNADGQLLAWAVMQVPFWAIDYACHPDCLDELHGRLLYWADRRARFALDTPSGRPAWFVNVFSDQVDRIRDLEAAGFASQADVGDDSWSKVLMRCTLQTPAAVYPLPAGFTVRPLGGQAEVEAYVTLHRTVFESRNMTVGWRARTLRQPSYIPDLDLVAVAPDGAFVGFCVGWLHRHEEEASGQIEPMGVHPDLRQQGLGQAIVSDALRRLRLHGAGQACVETDTHRNGALALYESVGFRAEREVLVYRRDYAPG